MDMEILESKVETQIAFICFFFYRIDIILYPVLYFIFDVRQTVQYLSEIKFEIKKKILWNVQSRIFSVH